MPQLGFILAVRFLKMRLLFFLILLLSTAANACELDSALGKPLNEPALNGLQDPAEFLINLTFPRVSNWLAGVAMNSLSIENGRLAGPSQNDFTERGQKEFISLLSETGKLSELVSGAKDLDTLVKHVPVLIYAGVSGKSYVWNYDLPLILLSKNPEKPALHFTAHVRIVRTNDPAHPKGIAIDQWKLAEGRSY